MSIQTLGAGSVATADLRSAMTTAGALPTAPHFLVRASHSRSITLVTLTLDFVSLLPQPVSAPSGWIAVPINQPLSVGEALLWTVVANAAVPKMGAFLALNGKLKYLKHKNNLAAGVAWSPNPVVLRSSHLS
ncbi:MAG: hypothetical protein K0U98_04405 [Deltaproteobacteria bacterium]|nr:hypothetical protein [Deltaproteobacteria bacterium]